MGSSFPAMLFIILLIGTSFVSVIPVQKIFADDQESQNRVSGDIKDSDKKPLEQIDLKKIKSQMGLQPNEERVIVIYKDHVKKQDKDKLENKGAKIKTELDSVRGVAIQVDQAKIKEIASDPNVAQVVEDAIVHISLVQSVPQIGANLVHSAGVTGKNVKVCIVDTGVDDTHPSLNPLVAEHNFIDNGKSVNDATDDNGHGTHVAGIIASKDITYRGVAPDASLMAAKVLDSTGSGFTSTVVNGIDWCVANGAKVINLSLGGSVFTNTCDSTLDAMAVNSAVNSGVVVAVASGNNGYVNAISTPACASKAIAVGAVSKNDARTSFSNEGTELDVVAPGVAITSLNAPIKGGGFVALTGTSMATPHVAGLAALLLEKNHNLTPQQVRNNIQTNALDLGTSGFDTIYGFGRIRANNAFVATIPASVSVLTATGVGNVQFSTNNGGITSLSAVSESTLPAVGKPALSFPFGFFDYTVTGIAIGSTATITITYPSSIPAGTQFWKISGGVWTNISSLVSSNDGDQTVFLTIQDGGLGDSDGAANGQIVDPIGSGTFIPFPSGSISINTGGVGTNILVRGSGFAPSSTVSIMFDGITLTSTTATNGRLNVPLIIPSATRGIHTITVTDGTYQFTEKFNVVAPRITSTETSSSNSIVVSGSHDSILNLYLKGFTGNDPTRKISVLFNGIPVGSPVSPDKVGSYKAFSVIIPSATATGTNVISATDGANTASLKFYVVSSTIALSNPSGTSGTQVTLSGYGFIPNHIIHVTLDGASVIDLTSTSSGRILPNVITISGVIGSHTISASDDTNSVSRLYAITP